MNRTQIVAVEILARDRWRDEHEAQYWVYRVMILLQRHDREIARLNVLAEGRQG